MSDPKTEIVILKAVTYLYEFVCHLYIQSAYTPVTV